MAVETWVVDGNSVWKELTDIWVCDGNSVWKSLSELWVCDGNSVWKQVFVNEDPALLTSVDIGIAEDGDGGCGVGKCDRCVEWTTTQADDSKHHIRLLRSIGGGSFIEINDDMSIDNTCGGCTEAGCSSTGGGNGCECGHSCGTSGTSTQFRVRLEVDGTDTLVGLSIERTTDTETSCVAL